MSCVPLRAHLLVADGGAFQRHASLASGKSVPFSKVFRFLAYRVGEAAMTLASSTHRSVGALLCLAVLGYAALVLRVVDATTGGNQGGQYNTLSNAIIWHQQQPNSQIGTNVTQFARARFLTSATQSGAAAHTHLQLFNESTSGVPEYNNTHNTTSERVSFAVLFRFRPNAASYQSATAGNTQIDKSACEGFRPTVVIEYNSSTLHPFLRDHTQELGPSLAYAKFQSRTIALDVQQGFEVQYNHNRINANPSVVDLDELDGWLSERAPIVRLVLQEIVALHVEKGQQYAQQSLGQYPLYYKDRFCVYRTSMEGMVEAGGTYRASILNFRDELYQQAAQTGNQLPSSLYWERDFHLTWTHSDPDPFQGAERTHSCVFANVGATCSRNFELRNVYERKNMVSEQQHNTFNASFV